MSVSACAGWMRRAQRRGWTNCWIWSGWRAQAGKYPHELSGGQQQRIALARALAPQPDLLLLDEPFSNLDVDLRERLALEVRDILKELGTTAVLVTHDQHEAFAIADQIGVMHEGVIVQWDDAYNLYHRPPTASSPTSLARACLRRARSTCRTSASDRTRQPAAMAGVDVCATGSAMHGSGRRAAAGR